MTGAEHYRKGEEYLEVAKRAAGTVTEQTIMQAAESAQAMAAIAQAHFTAALVDSLNSARAVGPVDSSGYRDIVVDLG